MHLGIIHVLVGSRVRIVVFVIVHIQDRLHFILISRHHHYIVLYRIYVHNVKANLALLFNDESII
jgi:hypothetical protein